MLRLAVAFSGLILGLSQISVVEAQTSIHGTVISQSRVSGANGASMLLKSVRTFAGPIRLYADFLNRTGNTIRRDVEIGSSAVTGNQSGPLAKGLVNGGYAISWRNDHPSANGGVRYTVITAEGSHVARDFKANIRFSTSLTPSAVTAISNGGFAIAWRDTARRTNWIRYFNSLGTPISGESLN
jgi:hypothetical protein